MSARRPAARPLGPADPLPRDLQRLATALDLGTADPGASALCWGPSCALGVFSSILASDLMATKTAAAIASVSRGDATRYAPPGGSHVQRFAPASSGGALVTHTRSHGAAAPCGAASRPLQDGEPQPPSASSSLKREQRHLLEPPGARGAVYAKPLARQLLSAGPPGTGSREPGPRVASASSEPREPSEPVLLLYQTERPPGARDQAGRSVNRPPQKGGWLQQASVRPGQHQRARRGGTAIAAGSARCRKTRPRQGSPPPGPRDSDSSW